MSKLASAYGGRKTVRYELPEDLPDYREFIKLLRSYKEINEKADEIAIIFERILDAAGYDVESHDISYKLSDVLPEIFEEKLKNYIIWSAFGSGYYVDRFHFDLIKNIKSRLVPIVSNYLRSVILYEAVVRGMKILRVLLPIFLPITYEDLPVPYKGEINIKDMNTSMETAEWGIVYIIDNIDPNLQTDPHQYMIAQQKMVEFIEEGYLRPANALYRRGVRLSNEEMIRLDIIIVNNSLKKLVQSRSPVRSLPRSPVRSLPRSPVRTLSKSPVRSLPKSPVRTLSKSPVRSVSRSPVRTPPRSPVRTLSKSPVRSPIQTLSKSPVRSPVRTLSKSPVRSLSKSPVRTLSKSPVRSPVRTLPRSPVRSLPKSPVRSLSKSPIRTLPRSPVRSLPKSPVRSLPKSPVRTLSKSPVQTLSKSPARSKLASSYGSRKSVPAIMDITEINSENIEKLYDVENYKGITDALNYLDRSSGSGGKSVVYKYVQIFLLLNDLIMRAVQENNLEFLYEMLAAEGDFMILLEPKKIILREIIVNGSLDLTRNLFRLDEINFTIDNLADALTNIDETITLNAISGNVEVDAKLLMMIESLEYKGLIDHQSYNSQMVLLYAFVGQFENSAQKLNRLGIWLSPDNFNSIRGVYPGIEQYFRNN